MGIAEELLEHDGIKGVQTAELDADFVEHYGVKGMRWGTRKDPASKEPPSHDSLHVGNIHARVKTQKSTKQLSNKELQDAIARMNLEQQYSKMSGGLDKTRRQKGAAFVASTVSAIAKTQVVAIANTAVKQQVDAAMKNAKASSNGGGSK